MTGQLGYGTFYRVTASVQVFRLKDMSSNSCVQVVSLLMAGMYEQGIGGVAGHQEYDQKSKTETKKKQKIKVAEDPIPKENPLKTDVD